MRLEDPSLFFPLHPDAFQTVPCRPCQTGLRTPTGSEKIASIGPLEFRMTSLITDTAVISQAGIIQAEMQPGNPLRLFLSKVSYKEL